MSDIYSALLDILQDSEIKSLIISILTTFLAILGAVKARAEITKRKARKKNPTITAVRRAITTQFPNSVAKNVYGQFYHETGGGTSRLFLENNNLFGMKHPIVRTTTSIGADVYNYAVYNTVDDAVVDLRLWFLHNGLNYENLTSSRDYVTAIKSKNYFSDSYANYLKGLEYGRTKF
jgi:uncharacterized FlgJ-related protein